MNLQGQRFIANSTSTAAGGGRRASELGVLYRTVVATNGADLDARLAALMAVQAAVRAAPGGASGSGSGSAAGAKELMQLIDREVDLLNRWASWPWHACNSQAARQPPALPLGLLVSAAPSTLLLHALHGAGLAARRGRSPAGMEGLRQRISNCFLELLKAPSFNPEAAVLGAALGGGGGRAVGRPTTSFKFTRRNAELADSGSQTAAVSTGVQAA